MLADGTDFYKEIERLVKLRFLNELDSFPKTFLQLNKTRTSKVGAISKAQKAQKTFFEKKLKFSKFYRIFFSKNQKNRLSGAPGPASASPWRA